MLWQGANYWKISRHGLIPARDWSSERMYYGVPSHRARIIAWITLCKFDGTGNWLWKFDWPEAIRLD